MKLLSSFLIILCFTYFGNEYNKKFSKRYGFYKSFYDFILQFSNNLSYSNEKIKVFLEQNETSFSKVVYERLHNKKKQEFPFLTKQEELDFYLFVDNLGNGNSESQIDLLKAKEKEIYNKMCEEQAKMEKYKNLYTKLGFLLGLMIVILIY